MESDTSMQFSFFENDCDYNGLQSSKVILRGIARNVPQKRIENFFGNPKRGGGNIKEFDRDPETGDVYLTFENPIVAAQLAVRQEIDMTGSRVTIELVSVIGNIKSIDEKSLYISGNFSDLAEEDIKDLLESKEAGHFLVETVEKLSDLEALVTFENEEELKEAIEKNVVAVGGMQISFSLSAMNSSQKFRPTSNNTHLQTEAKRMESSFYVTHSMHTECKQSDFGFHSANNLHVTDDSFEVEMKESQINENFVTGEYQREPGMQLESSANMKLVFTVEVSGFGKDCTESVIQMFLKNKRKSGGGEIDCFTYKENEGKALVTYCNSDDAMDVLNFKHLQFDGQPLTVVPLDTVIDLNGRPLKSCALLVRGTIEMITQETLTRFFENKRKSGGGVIEDMWFDVAKNIAVVTFAKENDLENVLQKKDLKLGDTNLYVSRLVAPPPPPLLSGIVYNNRFIVNHLADNCGPIVIKAFLEKHNNSLISNIMFSPNPGTALIFFKEDQSILQLRKLLARRPLCGCLMTIQQVPVSCTIQVNCSSSLKPSTLELYFEDCQNGGEVSEVKTIDEKIYLITFASSAVADKLTQCNHLVEGKQLTVQLFYKDFGLVPIGFDCKNPCMPLPKIVEINVASEVIDFILDTPHAKGTFDQEVSKLHARIEWPAPHSTVNGTVKLKVSCLLTYQVKDYMIVAKNWEDKVMTVIQNLFDRFTSETVKCLQEIWPQLKIKALEQLEQNSKETCMVKVNDNLCTVNFVGIRAEVKEKADRLKSCVQQIEASMQRASKIVTEKMDKLKDYQLWMLQESNFTVAVKDKHNVDMLINISSSFIELTGLPDEVKMAQLSIYELTYNLKDQCLSLSNMLLNLLKLNAVRSYVKESLKKLALSAVWKLEDNGVMVYSSNADCVKKAAGVIRESIVEKQIEIIAETETLLSGKKWQNLVAEFSKSFGDAFILTANNRVLFVASISSIIDRLLEDIQRFTSENTICHRFIKMPFGTVKFVTKYMESELQKINSELSCYQVNIFGQPDKSKPLGFNIYASIIGIEDVQKQLMKVLRNVSNKKFHVDKPGMPKYFNGNKGKLFLQQMEDMFNVIIEVLTEDDPTFSHENNFTEDVGHTIHYQSVVHNLKLLVIQSDITCQKVDAIVNAANSQLEHYGGVAKAIVVKGGDSIQEECRQFMKNRKANFLSGDIFISKAGLLPCRMVIHTVGPRWQDGKSNEKNQLYDAVYESLKAADDAKCQTIALPAISSGIYGFPLQLCCEVIVEAIVDYCKSNPSYLKEIHLVDSNKTTIKSFGDALEKFFLEVKIVNNKIPDLQQNLAQLWTVRGTIYGAEEPSAEANLPNINCEWTTEKKGSDVVLKTRENISVIFRKADITDENVDVIVNTTAANLVLANGSVSALIAEKAGPSVQLECSSKYPNGIKYNEIAVTSGGNLQCQYIYHCALPAWSSNEAQVEKMVKKVIYNCLNSANKSKCTTIALPAFGTGKLGYPRELVAKWFFDEVCSFSRKLGAKCSLQYIHLILYPKDFATIHAFEEYAKNITEYAKNITGSKRIRQLAKTFSISSSLAGGSVSNDSDYDMSNSGRIAIGELQVEVCVGDIVKENTVAVVNSIRGMVSQVLATAAGPSYSEEFKIAKISDGIAITGAGLLPCKHVIHIDANEITDPTQWKSIMRKVLFAAETNKMTSISFPILGSGAGRTQSSIMAAIMVDAVGEFCETYSPKYLKLVRIIAKDKHALTHFQTEMKRIVEEPQKTSWVKKIKDNITGWFTGGQSKPQLRATLCPAKKLILLLTGQDASVEKVYNCISTACNSETMEKVLDSPDEQEAIAKLEEEDIAAILSKQSSGVSIIIDKDKRVKRIRIQGLPEDVTDATASIIKLLTNIHLREHEKYEAERVAKSVCWKYEDGSSFDDYSSDINAKIEIEFAKGKDCVEWMEDKGQQYKIVFKDMKEYMMNGSKIVTQKDVKRVSKESVKLPDSWDTMATSEIFKQVLLIAGSAEYKTVEKNIMQSSGGQIRAILKIERIQNPTLYQSYQVKKAQLESINPTGTNNERVLWHGTAANKLQSINTNGFNRSFAGQHAVVYGRGTYFARDSAYSTSPQYSPPDANSHRYMYQCLVLTGEFAVGNQNIAVPPNKPSVAVPYDSLVDNVTNPTIFVIFHDCQVYPEYLITFQ